MTISLFKSRTPHWQCEFKCFEFVANKAFIFNTIPFFIVHLFLTNFSIANFVMVLVIIRWWAPIEIPEKWQCPPCFFHGWIKSSTVTSTRSNSLSQLCLFCTALRFFQMNNQQLRKWISFAHQYWSILKLAPFWSKGFPKFMSRPCWPYIETSHVVITIYPIPSPM